MTAAIFFFLMIRRPPRSTLFPYTRSSDLGGAHPAQERGQPLERGQGPVVHAAAPRARGRGALRLHGGRAVPAHRAVRSEEHTSELQSRQYIVCRLLLEKKKTLSCLTDTNT